MKRQRSAGGSLRERESRSDAPSVARVSRDGKPGVQAIGKTAPDLPPVPGRRSAHACERKRRGRVRHGRGDRAQCGRRPGSSSPFAGSWTPVALRQPGSGRSGQPRAIKECEPFRRSGFRRESFGYALGALRRRPPVARLASRQKAKDAFVGAIPRRFRPVRSWSRSGSSTALRRASRAASSPSKLKKRVRRARVRERGSRGRPRRPWKPRRLRLFCRRIDMETTT